MDEPLSSLDAKLRAELRLELKRIQHDLGATILYVTHDQIEAMTMADRIGVLDQGRLVQVGTPREIYEDPADIYVATRLGSRRINLLPRGLLPDRADAGRRDAPSARAPSICAIARRQRRQRPATVDVDRASRRPEPPACHRRRPQAASRWSIRTSSSTVGDAVERRAAQRRCSSTPTAERMRMTQA